MLPVVVELHRTTYRFRLFERFGIRLTDNTRAVTLDNFHKLRSVLWYTFYDSVPSFAIQRDLSIVFVQDAKALVGIISAGCSLGSVSKCT